MDLVKSILRRFTKKQESSIALDRKTLVDRFGEIIHTLDEKEVKVMKHIAATLDRLQEPISVVYDIGAYNGIWSKAFAIYTQGKVYSFEPNPEVQEEFKERTQRFNDVYLQPVACGAEEKEAVEYIDEHKGAASSLLAMSDVHKREFIKTGESHSVDINIVSLDEWIRHNDLPIPQLLKMDVQGYELEVIKGSIKILEKVKYIWCELSFKELYENGSTFSSINSKLNSLSFELVDCADLVRSKSSDQLLYMDGIFRNIKVV